MQFLKGVRQLAKNACFSQAKVKSSQSIQPKTLIINENLKFSAKEFDLFMIPSHPKIITKGSNYFEIDTTSPVVELVFVKKSKNDQDLWKFWGGRKTFELNFNQLHQLLDVQIGSGISSKIQKHKNCNYYITDMNKKGEVLFTSQQKIGQEIVKFNASIQSSEFTVLQSIVKQSLFELSGLSFIYEMKRMQQLETVKKTIKQHQMKEQQVKSFYA